MIYRMAWRRTGPAPRAATKKAPSLCRETGGLEKKTGGALLSHAPGRSTIAAGALNVRVREGNGCDSPAKATGQKINNWKRKRRKEGTAEGVPRGRAGGRVAFSGNSCPRPRPFRFRGSAGGGAGKPHGLSEPVC